MDTSHSIKSYSAMGSMKSDNLMKSKAFSRNQKIKNGDSKHNISHHNDSYKARAVSSSLNRK